MQISEIKIRKIFNENVLKAIVSVTFDNCFTVHDIKIVCANSRYFTVMPNKKSKDGRLSDIAHPINKDFRELLESEILRVYFFALGNAEKTWKQVEVFNNIADFKNLKFKSFYKLLKIEI